MILFAANIFIAHILLVTPALNIDVLTSESSPGHVEIKPCIENAGETGEFSYSIQSRKTGANSSLSTQKGTVRVQTGEKKCDFARSTVSVGEGQKVEIIYRVYQQGTLIKEKIMLFPSD